MKRLIFVVLLAIVAWQGYSVYKLRSETVAVLQDVSDTDHPTVQVPDVNTTRPTLQPQLASINAMVERTAHK